jgi:ATP-dependent 26S proteasome regulatory subunit
LADRRGVLLHGRPGTGKTWALEWVQAEVAEANDSATVIVTTPMMFGHGSPMKDLFDFAEEAAPVLIVMEDVDLAHLNRKMGPVGTDALGEMLQFMDGPARVRGAFVAATTNYPQVLDSALTKRPGRFDRKIEVGDAHTEARRQMAELLLERIGGSTERVDAIVNRTDGWSLAELDEAAHLAVLTSLDTGEPVDLLGALDQVHRGEQGITDSKNTTTGYV